MRCTALETANFGRRRPAFCTLSLSGLGSVPVGVLVLCPLSSVPLLCPLSLSSVPLLLSSLAFPSPTTLAEPPSASHTPLPSPLHTFLGVAWLACCRQRCIGNQGATHLQHRPCSALSVPQRHRLYSFRWVPVRSCPLLSSSCPLAVSFLFLSFSLPLLRPPSVPHHSPTIPPFYFKFSCNRPSRPRPLSF